MKDRILCADIGQYEGKKVILAGWVNVRRDHGKIIFIDLRDRSGLAQCVFLGNTASLFKQAGELRPEWVVELFCLVQKRPASLVNADMVSGQWECVVENMKVLNQSETLPIAIDTDGYEIGEEHRLTYRYLDIRRSRLQNNLMTRHRLFKYMRDYLGNERFIEVETPIISKSTPEGARDFLIPSRKYPGKVYALPQSPQQYKQLLMVGSLERYFQIARCFRDEDTRGDRQPEFTQLDLEMSFVTQEEIMHLMESMFISLVKALYPHKKIMSEPFPRLTYAEAMKLYGRDNPDIRKNKDDMHELAFCWVIDFPFFEKNSEGEWTFTHNPFSSPADEDVPALMAGKRLGEIKTMQYDLVLNGSEIGGGSIRAHRPEVLRRVLHILGHSDEDIEDHFGHMLKAFEFGAPPHGGIALGLDRIVAMLQNEPNIREVIAFPKTGDAQDLMMQAPSASTKDQLDELGLETKKRKK